MEGFEPPSFRSVVGCPIQLGHISISLSPFAPSVTKAGSRPTASKPQEAVRMRQYALLDLNQ